MTPEELERLDQGEWAEAVAAREWAANHILELARLWKAAEILLDDLNADYVVLNDELLREAVTALKGKSNGS